MTIYSKRAFKTRFQYRLLSKLGTGIWQYDLSRRSYSLKSIIIKPVNSPLS